MFGHPNITTALWLFFVLGNLSWVQCPASASSISWKIRGSESWGCFIHQGPWWLLPLQEEISPSRVRTGLLCAWESRGCLGDRLTQHTTKQECIWGWSLAGKTEKEKLQESREQNPDFYHVVFKRRVIFLGAVPGFSVPGFLFWEPDRAQQAQWWGLIDWIQEKVFPVAKEVRLDMLDESRHYSSSVFTCSKNNSNRRTNRGSP